MPLSHRLPRHPRFTPMRDRGCLHLTNLPSFEQRCSESEREQERQLAHTWYQFTCGFVNPALVSKCGRWAVVLWLQLNHDSNIHHLSKGDPWIICVGSWTSFTQTVKIPDQHDFRECASYGKPSILLGIN